MIMEYSFDSEIPAVRTRASILEDIDEQIKHAYNRILRCTSISEQSTLKMRAKLERDGYSEQAIESALEKAVASGALDDVRYCECLFRNTLSQGKGLIKAIAEAEQLGVDHESLYALEDVTDEGEEGMIARALDVLSHARLSGKNRRASAMRKLVAKCYPYDIAQKATMQFFERDDA